MVRVLGDTPTAQIRVANEADADKLADLCTQLGYPSSVEQVRERMREIVSQPQRCLLVVEDAAHGVGGFVDLELRTLIVAEPVVEICGLVVDAAIRSRGYGRLLLAAAERWGMERGAAEIALRSNIIRKEAHKFYEREGYVNYKQSYAFKKKFAHM